MGETVFPVCRDHVAEVVLVDDDAITAAQRVLWQRLRLVVEPAAATGVAAMRTHAVGLGDRVGIVLSGANADPATVAPPA